MSRSIDGVGVPDDSRHAGVTVNYIASQLGPHLSGAWFRAHAQVLHEIGERLKGFTQEDVEILRVLVCTDKAWMNARQEITSLADRIESLLPPRERSDA